MKSNRVVYGLIVVAALAFSLLYYGNLSFILLVFVLALPLVSLLISLLTFIFAKVKIENVQSTYRKNDMFKVTVGVSNRTPFAISPVVIKASMPSYDASSQHSELIFAIKPFNKEKLHLKFNLSYRGSFSFSANELVCYDLLRIFKLKRKLKESRDVLVLPRLFLLDDADTNALGEIESPLLLVNDVNGSEQNFIRKYVQGDLFHNIHWKISAKQDEYMVRQMASGVNTGISLFCDFYGYTGSITDAEIADICAEAAIALSCHAMRSDEQIVNYFYNAAYGKPECAFVANESDFNRLFYIYAQARSYSDSITFTDFCATFLEASKDAGTAVFITPCVTDALFEELKQLSGALPRIILIEAGGLTSDKVKSLLAQTPRIETCYIYGKDMVQTLNLFLNANGSN